MEIVVEYKRFLFSFDKLMVNILFRRGITFLFSHIGLVSLVTGMKLLIWISEIKKTNISDIKINSFNIAFVLLN